MEKLNLLKIFLLFLCIGFFSVKCDITYSSNSTETTDRRVSNAGSAIVFSANLTLDGAGFVYTFPPTYSSSSFLVVDNTVSATVTNLMFQYLRPEHISLGSGSDLIFGNGSNVQLGESSTLSYTWKFGGASSVLDGRHKTLTLGSGGAIEVQAGGNLTLRNITIYDVLGTNLRCADNTATITFDNVKIINRNTWNFAAGAFAVTNNLTMLGGGKFVYQSAYASTVNDNSTLFLSDGMTFSYDPAKGSGQAVSSLQNLVFTNSSSKMICDGITLKITNTGMRLTKGTIQFDRKNSIYSDATLTDTAHGFILGDTTYSNDPQVIFGPDARVNLESGVMQYDVAERLFLRYGDSVLLRHKAFGLYISWEPTLNIGGFASSTFCTTTPTANSYLYVGAGNSGLTWGSGLLETAVLTGSSYVKFVLAPPYVSLSFYMYPATISTPTPPYYIVYAHAAYDSYDYNPLRFYKKGGSVGQNIFVGDDIYIMTYYGGFARYLGSSNLTYSGAFKELIQYASAGQPANLDSHLTWVVEAIVQKAYLNIPTNYSGTAPTVSGWPAASTFQF